MRKKRSRHSTNRSSREDSQHRKFLETLICKACPYARQCRNGTCIAPKYRQERMRKLQEFSRDARKRSMPPPAEDVEELSELLKAAAKHLQETVERRESLLEDDRKEQRFCRHCRRLLSGELRGTWNVTRRSDGKLGTVYSFEFEGETYIYGWDDKKEKIDFYVLPIFRSGDVITIREENYMVQSDFALQGHFEKTYTGG